MLLDRELYKCSASGILQRCIPTKKGRQLIQKIHSGACGHHAAPQTLVGNAFRQGFYWPTTVADATEIVRACEGCQFYVRQTHLIHRLGGLLLGTMMRGTQIMHKTFSSTKTKARPPVSNYPSRLRLTRLAIFNRSILRHAQGPDTGSRTREVLRLARPQPLMPLSHWRARDPPCDVTHVPALTNQTSQERQGSNHNVVAHNIMGKSCRSLCHSY
jgi:hypothetical protein